VSVFPGVAALAFGLAVADFDGDGNEDQQIFEHRF